MIRFILILRPYARHFLILTIIAIISISSIPRLPTLKIHMAKSDIRLDYLIHFCEYGFLSFMAFLSFAGNEFKVIYRKFILISLSIIAFAILDEFHQKFIPGRSFNPKDIMSNITGVLGALIFCLVVFRKIEQSLKTRK